MTRMVSTLMYRLKQLQCVLLRQAVCKSRDLTCWSGNTCECWLMVFGAVPSSAAAGLGLQTDQHEPLDGHNNEVPAQVKGSCM